MRLVLIVVALIAIYTVQFPVRAIGPLAEREEEAKSSAVRSEAELRSYLRGESSHGSAASLSQVSDRDRELEQACNALRRKVTWEAAGLVSAALLCIAVVLCSPLRYRGQPVINTACYLQTLVVSLALIGAVIHSALL